MKILITFLFLLTLIFIYPQNKAFASDLNVECNDQAGCVLLRNELLFSDSLDGAWHPSRRLTKIINIKNSGLETREIRIKTKEISAGSLREVMNVSLSKSSGELIWQGKMQDFISQEFILGNQNSGENKDFLLEVDMASNANNFYQSTNTSFELALGFEAEEESVSEEQSSGNSSSGEVESASNSDPAGNLVLIGNAFSRVFGVFADSEAQEASARREETDNRKEKDKDVLGAEENACSENYLWAIFIIIQAIFSTLLFVPRFRNRLKPLFAGNTIIFATSVIAIYFLSCLLWPILLSVAIFIVPIGFLLFKKYKSRM